MHRGVGKCVVVVEEKMKWGADVIMGVMEKVDSLVIEILCEEAKMVGGVGAELFGLWQGHEMALAHREAGKW